MSIWGLAFDGGIDLQAQLGWSALLQKVSVGGATATGVYSLHFWHQNHNQYYYCNNERYNAQATPFIS